MRAALALARRHLGETWPNPSVGCVIVGANGRVVGRGATAPGGRPHAETGALAMASAQASGATAYVTLEPCSHHGVTSPCADALIEAGIARVVAGIGDPDPRVSGRGLTRLRDAGLTVETGCLAAEVADLTAGFISRIERHRPLVTLKLATTLDGRIATATGESRWITGESARRATHRLRAEHDAILVGIGTALADDPDLTCRLAGSRRRPLVRIVLDRTLRLPPRSRLAATAQEDPVWVVHAPEASSERAQALRDLGVRLITTPAEPDRASAAVAALAAAGLTRILVEGGAQIAATFLQADVVDRLAWFTAPALIGADGLAAIAPLALASLADAKRFTPLHTRPAGHDMFALFARST
jgi:diaminohydroxyphosphoribosylaminopyrimidine deaminase/5-amino-6-(5-phosphoribosylamino)uracil reductase